MRRLFVSVRNRKYFVKKREEGLVLDLCDAKINSIDEIVGLDKLGALNKLNLGKNNITEIKGLDSLTELKSLIIGYNKVTRIQGLYALTKLTHLSLDSNQITRMEGFEHLANLESLYLTNNKIDEIKGLENLARLQYLKLSENKITRIDGLHSLKRLHLLALDGNKIREIENLESLIDLRELYLFGNEITEKKGLEHLKELRILSLDNNLITGIKGLQNQVSLIDFGLHGNPISKEARKHAKVAKLFVSRGLHRFTHPYYRHRRVFYGGFGVLVFALILFFIPNTPVLYEGLVYWVFFESFARSLRKYEIHLSPPIQKLEGYIRIIWVMLACGIITDACSYIYRLFVPLTLGIESLLFWIMITVFIGFIVLAGIGFTKLANELERQAALLKVNE
jgi:hypothetical protein